jgi:hypothetical protein
MAFKGQKMNVFVKGWLEEIMTSEPKIINTILDDLFIHLDKKAHKNVSKRIPTRNELYRHLNANYSKVKLSMITGKPVKKKGLMHYFREE